MVSDADKKEGLFDIAWEYRKKQRELEALRTQKEEIDKKITTLDSVIDGINAELFAYCRDKGLLNRDQKYILQHISSGDFLMIDLTKTNGCGGWTVCIVHTF